MSDNHQDELRAIWQTQFTTTPTLTPEQLVTRARELESKARRNVRVNQVSSALLALILAVSLFMHPGGLLFVVGKIMLLCVALYLTWGMSYFFAPLPIPVGSGAVTCAALHKRQLERQRDLNLSIRSGMRLILPGAILILIGPFWPHDGSHFGPEAWVVPIAIVASVLFLCEIGITYGQIIARQLQQEIDELNSMTRNWRD